MTSASQLSQPLSVVDQNVLRYRNKSDSEPQPPQKKSSLTPSMHELPTSNEPVIFFKLKDIFCVLFFGLKNSPP
jgi:hypothetical protein